LFVAPRKVPQGGMVSGQQCLAHSRSSVAVQVFQIDTTPRRRNMKTVSVKDLKSLHGEAVDTSPVQFHQLASPVVHHGRACDGDSRFSYAKTDKISNCCCPGLHSGTPITKSTPNTSHAPNTTHTPITPTMPTTPFTACRSTRFRSGIAKISFGSAAVSGAQSLGEVGAEIDALHDENRLLETQLQKVRSHLNHQQKMVRQLLELMEKERGRRIKLEDSMLESSCYN